MKRCGSKIKQEKLDKINKARKEVGLPLLVVKKLKCLKCDTEFLSQDATNQRLCDRCRLANRKA